MERYLRRGTYGEVPKERYLWKGEVPKERYLWKGEVPMERRGTYGKLS